MKTQKIFLPLQIMLMVALACTFGEIVRAFNPRDDAYLTQQAANPPSQTFPTLAPPPTSANPAIQPARPTETPGALAMSELINPGFEEGILGWAEDPAQFEWGGESVAETGEAHTGNQSRKLWLRWGGSNIGQRVLAELQAGSQVSLMPEFPAGSQVSLTAWVKMPFPGEKTNKWFTLELTVGAADGRQDMLFVDQMNALPNWTQLSLGPLITQFPVIWIEVRARTTKGNGSNNNFDKPIWVDDFQLIIQTP